MRIVIPFALAAILLGLSTPGTAASVEEKRAEVRQIEAMRFYIRETFERLPGAGIEVADFRAVGGGSKSDAWIQVSADILGRPFVRPKIH